MRGFAFGARVILRFTLSLDPTGRPLRVPSDLGVDPIAAATMYTASCSYATPTLTATVSSALAEMAEHTSVFVPTSMAVVAA